MQISIRNNREKVIASIEVEHNHVNKDKLEGCFHVEMDILNDGEPHYILELNPSEEYIKSLSNETLLQELSNRLKPDNSQCSVASNDSDILKEELANPDKFTWSDKEDPELYKNGVTIMWVVGRTKAIQKFVEELSYAIGYKCDFSMTAGRAHIDVLKEALPKCREVLTDEFLSRFIVPYSQESYDNETYFEIK